MTLQLPQVDYKGKVRDIYNIDQTMIIVASDRISAFDVIFNEPVPNKGKILTSISNHWFSLIAKSNICKSHIIETNLSKFPIPFSQHHQLDGRSVFVNRVKRIDFECVVRGYLLGSGYKEYTKNGTVCGIQLPSGLKQADKLPEPIFTPATKVDQGHDENVSFEFMQKQIGSDLSNQLKKLSIDLYIWASKKLESQNILLLDTKFEFGILNNEIILIDEVFTPDSSRFSDKTEYENAVKNGKTPPSMDKQIVRDYLETLDWNKQPPPPKLPNDIIEKTKEQYLKIEKKILNIE